MWDKHRAGFVREKKAVATSNETSGRAVADGNGPGAIHTSMRTIPVWMACSHLWLQDDFNAAIFFMFKDLVSMRSFVEAQSMSDDKRGINLAMFNAP